jgi:hypothetical protein
MPGASWGRKISLDHPSRSDVIGILKRHGLYLKKSLGQNFLVDPEALDRIIEAIDPQP